MKKTNARTSLNLRFAVLATDVVCFRIIEGKLSVLLGKVTTAPHFIGKWSVIGGLILAGETAEQAVDRHLRDKAGIKNIYKEQLYTFSKIDRDPRGRVVSVAYIALANSDIQDANLSVVETKWAPVNELPHLAYDHDEIVSVAVDRLQSKLQYTTLARHLLPSEFTLSELQKVYEVVLGREVDKRNFRKKILATNTLKDTKRVRKDGVMRPAALYSFTAVKTHEVEMI